MDKNWRGFSAGKLLTDSCLLCVNFRQNLNPCLFMYCTRHMTTSTSCVWLKLKSTSIGWFHPLCLLQSSAISRTHNSLTLNQVNAQTGKHVLHISRPNPCVDICAYAQSHEWVNNNEQRIKTITSLWWRTMQHQILCKPGSLLAVMYALFWCMLNTRLPSRERLC